MSARELSDLAQAMGLDAVPVIRDYHRDTVWRAGELTGAAREHARIYAVGPTDDGDAAPAELVEHYLGDVDAADGHRIHGGRVMARNLPMAANLAATCRAYVTAGKGSLRAALDNAQALLTSSLIQEKSKKKEKQEKQEEASV